MSRLALAPDLDVEALAAAFAVRRRLRIPGVLAPDSAEAVTAAMEAFNGWSLAVNAGGEQFELPLKDGRAADPGKQSWIDGARLDAADGRMQYLYDTRRMLVENEAGTPIDIVGEVPVFLNSEPFLDFVRKVTGDPRIALVDAQGTRYRTGQVLTTHDDNLAEKGRLYAYVLSLTREWYADWGGVLIFPGEDGHIDQGFVPSFNGLNLFAVPMAHAVTQVATFAARDRYSITGWLRTG